jgi:hypothetical protein
VAATVFAVPRLATGIVLRKRRVLLTFASIFAIPCVVQSAEPIRGTGTPTQNAKRHGFAGQRSTFAPSLLDSLKAMSYADFTRVVIGGRNDVNTANDKVMPSSAADRNVMCYLDDIYVYLRARSDGELGGGRPEKHVKKPTAAAKAETASMDF